MSTVLAMPMFSNPRDHHPGAHLLKQLGLLFGMVGWATVAVGLATRRAELSLLALVGLLIHLAAPRAPLGATIAEAVVFSLAVALVAPAAREWMWVGLTVIVIARSAEYAVKRLHPAD